MAIVPPNRGRANPAPTTINRTLWRQLVVARALTAVFKKRMNHTKEVSMRLIIPISLILLLLAILLPILFVGQADLPITPKETEPPELIPSPDSVDSSLPIGHGQDEALLLQVLVGDTVETMSMQDFLYGAVAAEMPARFHPEALRAQAIAARTYTLHRLLISPSPRHPTADVCGSYVCCKAFLSPQRLRERWGASYDHYSQIIRNAVSDTDGVILTYGDIPILAAFHAASSGHTEASGAIWGSVPYLQSVETFESAADVPNYYEETRLTFSAFRETALDGIPGAVLDYDQKPYWISNLRYTDSGRVESLNIGGIDLGGADFRRLFGLRSTAIRFSFDADGIAITTRGHGHGVGMSQFGANTMAHMGHSFEEILRWYYTKVNFNLMDAVLPFQ